MTPEQFKRFRLTHYSTQAALAQALGVTQGSVNKWEAGLRTIPGPVLKLAALVAAHHNVKRWLEQIAPATP